MITMLTNGDPFVSNPQDVDITNAGEISADAINFEITWDIDWEGRSWGVKGFYIIVEKVTGTCIMVTYNAKDEEIETEVEFSSDIGEWEIKVEQDTVLLNDHITPDNLEIDYDTHIITVTF